MLASSLGTLNPFRYRGYVYDEETGLYYLRSRYYHPAWGRFLNADKYLKIMPQVLKSNIFSYCEQDPINSADSDGNTTYAIGIEGNAALALAIGVAGQLVIDDKGNIGFIYAGSFGGGTPSAAANGILTITNAETIFDLQGLGITGGGSAAFGLPVSVGIDVVSGTSQDGKTVVGGQIAIGVSTPFPEAHGTLSDTGVASMNWLPDFMRKWITDVIMNVYNSLPESKKDELNNILLAE